VQFARFPLVGVPRRGVTSVGLVERTTEPDPVDVVTPVPPLATASVDDKPAAVPVVFWFSVGNVQFARLPDVGVPSMGDTSVGLVANTKEPEPVSSVTVAARFALVGVPKNVATPVPSPETPVDTGNPVALVRVTLLGVPSAGVTSVGLVERTTEPDPVDVVTPVPPLSTGKIPEVITEADVDAALIKSEPFHAITAFSLALIVTAVPPSPLKENVYVPDKLLTT
jgi:hypothetical protein